MQAIQELTAIAAAGYPVHGWLAIGHLGVGDHEKALDAIEAAVEAHDSWMPTNMHVEPIFAPLRGNPRYERLLKITGHVS